MSSDLFDSGIPINSEGVKHLYFGSLDSFAHYCHVQKHSIRPDESSDWFGYINSKETHKRTLNGDESLVSPAQDIISQVLADAPETQGTKWSPSPCGAYPIVPEYLAGVPHCMRAHAVTTDERNPIKVFVSFFVSGGVDKQKYIKRGYAIMAMLLALQSRRPIDLTLFIACGDIKGYLTIDVETKPLAVAQVAFALTHPGFFRHFGNGAMYALGSSTLHSENHETIKTWLGFDPVNDIYVPAQILRDPEAMAVENDPIAWVNRKVRNVLEPGESPNWAAHYA